MRYTILALVVLALCATAMAAPAKKENTCAKNCGDSYDPVCGKAKNTTRGHLITFGSECVMANYNCSHPAAPFEVQSKGECGGSVSVLLS